MKELGFDKWFDYKKVDFTKRGIKYDLIIDAKSKRAPWSFLKAMKPSANYVSIGGDSGRLIQILIFSRVLFLLYKKRFSVLNLKVNKSLDKAESFLKKKQLQACIDGPYSLEQAAELIKYFGEGKHFGKLVLNIN